MIQNFVCVFAEEKFEGGTITYCSISRSCLQFNENKKSWTNNISWYSKIVYLYVAKSKISAGFQNKVRNLLSLKREQLFRI